MSLLPLQLTAISGNWQKFSSRLHNPKFIALQQKILLRDNNTCRYCNFEAKQHQVVVNINNKYISGHNNIDNMATACLFCSHCFFLDSIGKNNNSGGYIIYLPEITQAELNHFCRILFVALLGDNQYKGKLQTIFLSLKDRSHVVDNLFGPDSSDPSIFGQTLMDCNLSTDKAKNSIIQSLRFLPERKYYQSAIQYWRKHTFAHLPL